MDLVLARFGVQNVDVAIEDFERLAGEAYQPLDVVLRVIADPFIGCFEDHNVPSVRVLEQIEVFQDQDPVAVKDWR